MFQQNERIRLAEVLNAYALLRSFGGNKQLVLRHLAETNHGWSGHSMFTKDAVPLGEDQAVGRAVANRDRSLWKHGQFFSRVVPCAIGDPILAIPDFRHFFDRTHGSWKYLVGLSELRIYISLPVEHADQVVQVVVVFGYDVFREKFPIDNTAFDFRLEHCKHVTSDLGLIRHKRSGRMQDSGVHLPSGSW